jgi:hypothetical protein
MPRCCAIAVVAFWGALGCTDGAPQITDPGKSRPGSNTSADASSAVAQPTPPSIDAAGAANDGGVNTEPSPDLDHDGIPDAEEDRIAHEYLPYLAVSASDGCPLGLILYRLRPHPSAAGLLQMVVDHLYQRDCGALGHLGDDETFGVTIDPSRPAPAGIVAIRAVAHQATACEATTECGQCPGMNGCDTGTRRGLVYPVVYSSKDKHGSYTDRCNGSCFLTNYCSLPPTPNEPMMVNAGEPDAPLTHDLTISGAITEANGWTEQALFHFDPWGTPNFGGAGNVASDLVDPAFVARACSAP